MIKSVVLGSAAAAAVGAYWLSKKLEVCGNEDGWSVPWLFGAGRWKIVGEVVQLRLFLLWRGCEGMQGLTEDVAQVASLHVYPVKSCRGSELDRIEIDMFGAANDRRFMVVDEGGRFITQRQEAVMCRIRAEMLPDGDVMLSLSGSGITSQCCFKPVSSVFAPNAQVKVTVWDDEVTGVDQGDDVAGWLSAVLERPVRMVGMTAAFGRPTSSKFTPKSAVGHTAFSDGFPMLLISEASLDDLNSRLSTPLPMNRFRPNLVVRGCSAYDEDKWRMLFIGGIRLHVVKPCSRCKITTTDQETGYRGEEPLATLSTFRLKEHVKAPCGDSVDVFFGQNLCHESPGSVSKGDVVLARYWDYPWFMQSYSGFY